MDAISTLLNRFRNMPISSKAFLNKILAQLFQAIDSNDVGLFRNILTSLNPNQIKSIIDCQFKYQEKVTRSYYQESYKTLLIHAVTKKNEVIVRLLIEARANLNHPNSDDSNKTALHYAVSLGLFDIVKLLVESGANINVQDKIKSTPINDAICYYCIMQYSNVSKDQYKSIIEFLISSKASLTDKNFYGRDVYDIINEYLKDKDKDKEFYIRLKFLIEGLPTYDQSVIDDQLPEYSCLSDISPSNILFLSSPESNRNLTE
jgi:hypothetical protein